MRKNFLGSGGDSFLKKYIGGADEKDLNGMQGFTSADDSLHAQILASCQKSCLKEAFFEWMWIIVGVLISGTYIVQFFKNGMLPAYIVFAAIFALAAGINVRQMLGNQKLRKMVSDRQYQVHPVQVAHTVPRALSMSGQAAVKVRDMDGNVYWQELPYAKKVRRAYKKDADAVFTLVRFQGKDWKAAKFSLAYFPETDAEDAGADGPAGDGVPGKM